MRLSKKTKYALKSLSLLAKENGKGPLQISDLAKRERIPKKFLETILLALKNHGILQSRKGKGGGYLLNKQPDQISVGSIVRIFEGSFAPVPCVSGPPDKKCEECLDGSACGIRLLMQDVHDAVANILDHASLADMVEREENARRRKKEVPMYEI